MQREAVRAILNIGTDAAYQILEQALAERHRRSRATRSCSRSASCATSARRRCSPTSSRHVDHRGALAPVYLRAIESLGALRDPGGIAPLQRRAVQGRMVGAAADGGAAHRRGGRAGAHRHAGRVRRARGSGGARIARRPRRGARRSCRAARPPAARPEAAHDARRGCSSPTNCCAASRRRCARRSSTRRAIRSSRATSSRCRPPLQLLHSLAAGDRHRPGRRRGDRRRHADGEGRHARPAGPPAAAERHRAHHHRSRRDARRARDVRRRGRRRSSARRRRRRAAGVSGDAAHPRRPGHDRTARRRQPRRHGHDQAAVQRRRLGRPNDVWDSAQTEGQARRRRSRAR